MQPEPVDKGKEYIAPIDGKPVYFGEINPRLAFLFEEFINTKHLSGLSLKARSALYHIKNRSGIKKVCWPSQPVLMADIGCGKNQLIDAVEELEAGGWIKVTKITKPGRRAGKFVKEQNHYEPLWRDIPWVMEKFSRDRDGKNRNEGSSKSRLPVVSNQDSNHPQSNHPPKRSPIGVPGFKALADVPSPEASIPAGAEFANALSAGAKRSISEAAKFIYDRHRPDRRGRLQNVIVVLTEAVREAMEDAPYHDVPQVTKDIMTQYCLWEKSEDWKKEKGKYVMGLPKWLREHWTNTPKPPRDLMHGLVEVR